MKKRKNPLISQPRIRRSAERLIDRSEGKGNRVARWHGLHTYARDRSPSCVRVGHPVVVAVRRLPASEAGASPIHLRACISAPRYPHAACGMPVKGQIRKRFQHTSNQDTVRTVELAMMTMMMMMLMMLMVGEMWRPLFFFFLLGGPESSRGNRLSTMISL